MNHLIVYAHPNPASFNNAILKTAVNTLQSKGHEVVVRDLYALNFKSVLSSEDFVTFRSGNVPADIKTEQQFITQADVIIFIYPVWWAGLPAIIKGYVDRVFSHGFAYGSDENGIVKLLTGKKGFIINTHGQSKDYYNENGMTKSIAQIIETGIFDFVGIEPVGHLFFGSVPYIDDAARKQMLKEVEDKLGSLFG